jgi:AcrR family transcriptional regulator
LTVTQKRPIFVTENAERVTFMGQIRDREKTKQKLINAVGRLITNEGFEKVGVNAVAKEAGVDKVLIYRYFGGLNGLLETYVLQKDYYSNLKKQIAKKVTTGSEKDVIEAIKDMLLGQANELFSDKELQEILRWEVVNKNEITDTLAAERENQSIWLLNQIEKVLESEDIDMPALTAILAGGISYLILRAKHASLVNGIDIKTEEGWGRIEKTLSQMVDLVAGKATTN